MIGLNKQFYKAKVQLHLENCVQFISKRTLQNCEKVQRRETKMMRGLEHISFEDFSIIVKKMAMGKHCRGL